MKGEVHIISNQENLVYLSSTFSKLLKRSFGKGPESCHVILKGYRLYVYMRNFITPAEEVLISQGQVELAHNFRSAVIHSVAQEFIVEVSVALGISFDYFFHDWNYDKNTGIFLLDQPQSNHEEKIENSLQKSLFNLIENVASHYHKKPVNLKIVKFTQNICAIESKEVLLPLEKLVYEKGNVDLLLHQAWDIKDGYWKNKDQFEELFNRLIEDIFIMWDYKNNRNYLVFIFNKLYVIE
ncbi:Na-translocating system protein MpsC family protein [Neobacillus niacini]|uniref:Na-translocating system protein MpsC family protein n=1 Tax=Neobacillus niacini TaxID=86668 RepID=UPI0009ECFC83|nr:Na-translocating system protein MpsC family protein [Neobacillus niacini]MEC1525620.1 Na-translocating system protein MpsC family protein [Neobacillus niacini]